MRTFAELLTEYIERAGISDSELARSIGVRRQTLFRWKDGQIQRPRYRDDVLRCARRLRLTLEERDLLLTAAGFSPEAPPLSVREQPPEPSREVPPSGDSAEEPSQDSVPQSSVASSRRPWVIGFAGGLVIVVGIAVATAMLSNGDGEVPLAEALPTPTQTPEPTAPPATPTAVVETPVAETPEPETEEKAVETPTPDAGEDIVVIARFVNYIGGETGYNVAGRIKAALEDDLKDGSITDVEVEVLKEDVRDEAEAQEVAQRTNASIVIWGEYDSGRAQVRFTVPALADSMEGRQVERPVANASDLTATINTELPNDVRLLAHLILALLYEGGEDSGDASGVLDEALTTLPLEPDTVTMIYFRLGYLYQVREPPNLSASEKYYTLAILYGPDSYTAYFNRGLVYAARDEFDEAIDDYTESLSRNPRGAAALHNRGVAYISRKGPGDAVRAVDDLSKAIEIDGTRLESYMARGLAYFKLGGAFDDKSLDDFHHILTVDSVHKAALNNLCWFMSLVGRAAEGLPYCERALDINPDYGLAYDSRGLARALLGNHGEAIEDFDRFLEWLGTQSSDTYDRYGPRRERWVESLSKGENPFDEAELLALREE